MPARGQHRHDSIPNEPLRRAYLAYLADGNSAYETCQFLGWSSKDTSRLARRLGIMEQTTSHARGGERVRQDYVTLDLAMQICRIIGADFDDIYRGVMQPDHRDARGGRCETCRVALVQPVDDQLCGWCREVLTDRKLVPA